MAAQDDYYAVLGVSKSASDDEIKKAYRKAALRWHPDKNPENKEQAEEMFKNVAEAYEVLSDPSKRSTYDRFGRSGLGGAGPGGGGMGGFPAHNMTSAFNLFEQFFGGHGHDPFADFDDMFAHMQGAGAPQGAGGKGGGRRQRGSGMGMGGQGSMFGNDPFFSSGFAGGFGDGGFSSFSSSSTMGAGGGGGAMTSTSTTTKTVNGKRVTITEKTVRKADGTVERTRTESTSDGASATDGQRLGSSFNNSGFGDLGFSSFFGGVGGRGGSSALRW